MTITKNEYCTERELAAALLDSAHAHEASFDRVAADRATAAANAHNEGLEFTNTNYRWVEYASFYTKTLRQACEDTAGALAEPVYLLLSYAPNDAQDWAMEVLGLKERGQDFHDPNEVDDLEEARKAG